MKNLIIALITALSLAALPAYADRGHGHGGFNGHGGYGHFHGGGVPWSGRLLSS
jgi:hypothetical protein